MSEFLAFVAEHADILGAVYEALSKGTPKEAILKSIRAAAVVASDELMEKELGK